jgi:hypothetical protein
MVRAPDADAAATDGVTSGKGLAPIGRWFWPWEREPGGVVSSAGAILVKSELRAGAGDGVAASELWESGPGVIGGMEVGGVLPKSWRDVTAGVSPGDHSLVQMDGAEAGLAKANMAVMKPGGTESDDAGDASGHSCIGASRWPSKAAGANATPGSRSRAAEASEYFGENGDAGRTEDGED